MANRGTKVEMSNLVYRLLDAIDKERKRIVVIGDALIDVWVHGHIEECQDGCAKLVEESRKTTPGGAANAYNCLSNWKVNTSLFSWPSDDRPIKCRFVDASGKIVFRWDDERMVTKASLTRCQWARYDALEMVVHAGAVLLSDYDKGFLTPEFIRDVIDLCNKKGVPCVVDAKKPPEVYEGALIKCNKAYSYEQAHQAEVITDGDNLPRVVGDRPENNLPSVPCVNHVGAGDCFAAHLALALAYGFTLPESAALAHSAGRVYVQHQHNRPPQPDEIVVDMRG